MTDAEPDPKTLEQELEDDRQRSNALGKAIDKAEDKLKSHQPKPDHENDGGVI